MRIRNGCLFVALAALLVALPTMALAGGGGDRERQYDITGTWYVENNVGGHFFCSISLLENAPQHLVMLCDSSDTLPFYPARQFVAGSIWIGELERSGLNTYRYMQVGMFRDVDGSNPHIGYVNGTIEQMGEDTAVGRFRSANYPPGQSPWNGGEMHSCSPWLWTGLDWFVTTMTRVPFGEPCEPTLYPLP